MNAALRSLNLHKIKQEYESYKKMGPLFYTSSSDEIYQDTCNSYEEIIKGLEKRVREVEDNASL